MNDGTYVRQHYGVGATVGARVIADGKPGVIVGFSAAYIVVQIDGEKHPGSWHPTWHMEYLDGAA